MPAEIKNLLLSHLPDNEIELLRPDLKLHSFQTDDIFFQPHHRIETIHFLESGIASFIAETTLGRQIEVGLLGRDGMTGHALFANDTQSPFKCFAQLGGDALSISADQLMKHCTAHPSINRRFAAFARAFSLQTAFTILATGHSTIEQRLARWLLMVHDRIDGNVITITHGFLSMMLGVRRQGVTVALQILEGEYLIKSMRSTIKILDREGLIAAAHGSYGPAEDEYLRLTGVVMSNNPETTEQLPERV